MLEAINRLDDPEANSEDVDAIKKHLKKMKVVDTESEYNYGTGEASDDSLFSMESD